MLLQEQCTHSFFRDIQSLFQWDLIIQTGPGAADDPQILQIRLPSLWR